jgi:uncharacterized protein (TIGR02145 family)
MRKITKITTVIFLIFIACNGCKKDQTDQNSIPGADEGEFTDPRDGQVYPFKKIGTQVWMTKNLNYADGGSWCNQCDIYGRLYDWNTALTVAPKGWHLPSDAEWTILTNYLGGESIAGGKMKTTTGWNSPNTGATNSSGFAGLPGGSRFNALGTFAGIGDYGLWWSSTAINTDFALPRVLFHGVADVSKNEELSTAGLSVRCVRD